MNEKHLQLCASDEWAETVAGRIIPAVLQGAALGEEVLELGPGPGRTTEILCRLSRRLTAVELDGMLAAPLARRLTDTTVRVVQADATCLPLASARFSDVLSLTMLHHLPSIAAQDRLFREAARVLRPNGLFRGRDSLDSDDFRALHVDDICVPLDPATLRARLTSAGFADVQVEATTYGVAFRACKAAKM